MIDSKRSWNVHPAGAALLAMGLLATACAGMPSPPAAGTPSPAPTPTPTPTAAGHGVPQDGFPGWRERALLVLTNAARLAPVAYRDRYAADFTPSIAAVGAMAGYPAVGPLRWNLALNRTARAHSEDMGAHGCFQHDSCDGTNWAARIASQYTLSGTMGENIAAGHPMAADPRYAMWMWLCDVSAGSCCADRTGCDGHRANLMNGLFRAMGPGFAHVAVNFQNYWTQDLGGVADAPEVPLVDGSHILFPAGRITFLANVVDVAAPRSVTLVLAGVEQSMALDLGVPTAGTWSASVAAGSGCRAYHFQAVDAEGTAWRYPATGDFRTYGEGSCLDDWGP